MTPKEETILKELREAQSFKALEELYKKYLGKKGEITLIFRELKNLPKEKRAEIAQKANALKGLVEKEFKLKSEILKKEAEKQSFEKEKIDITLPGKKIIPGHLHPLTKILREIEEIFSQMGFEVVGGPEIENEYYNFDALNIPKEHPARDMWDTFWLKEPKNPKSPEGVASRPYGAGKIQNPRLLLRTHTSPVQLRYMEAHEPPFRIIVPGRCFRHEATDAYHDVQFYQVEGLMVGKDVNLANLKAIVSEFLDIFFKKKIKIRFQPGYFPFVEPGLEVLISKDGRKWLELIGAGMVHSNVFKAVGYNPRNLQGFAFGLGLDRLAMLKYKINDIRLFYGGDLRFLEQF
ncbi:MAG: phenylalanine--tRNA ligase subunit alpha [Parcubacteria group bacterium CG11_big_fil_rev_8_21_14_0_20_39_14]|nr:MAG: phenylalanine--tRNA ligase subunit alpha [Parcubacteria group bacterium CG11_big_fil_rev_8_21_14_0_20_39_14]PIS35440.1 MAG: phenylalanine--tRNA ligase subunit alpha [Parcubacteria group bacterium CG08_land_8_20_14_0_20_38_56]